MKKFIALLLALALVLSLGACTVTTTDETPTTQATEGNTNTEPAAEDVNITLWTYPIGGWASRRLLMLCWLHSTKFTPTST